MSSLATTSKDTFARWLHSCLPVLKPPSPGDTLFSSRSLVKLSTSTCCHSVTYRLNECLTTSPHWIYNHERIQMSWPQQLVLEKGGNRQKRARMSRGGVVIFSFSNIHAMKRKKKLKDRGSYLFHLSNWTQGWDLGHSSSAACSAILLPSTAPHKTMVWWDKPTFLLMELNPHLKFITFFLGGGALFCQKQRYCLPLVILNKLANNTVLISM